MPWHCRCCSSVWPKPKRILAECHSVTSNATQPSFPLSQLSLTAQLNSGWNSQWGVGGLWLKWETWQILQWKQAFRVNGAVPYPPASLCPHQTRDVYVAGCQLSKLYLVYSSSSLFQTRVCLFFPFKPCSFTPATSQHGKLRDLGIWSETCRSHILSCFPHRNRLV